MAILNNNPLVGASGNQGGYNINNSLRFRSSATAWLNRTPASAGNRKTFTISFWFKRGTLSVDQKFLSAYSADSDSGNMDFRLTSGNILYWGPWSTGMTTSAVFRDPSAWYHVVLTIDTTQATGANRHRVYVNGVEYTFSGTPVTQNTDLAWNNTIAHNIGRNARTSGDYFDGYMAEFYSIDGQALTPSSFGETDTITSVWKPKAYSGTYGTNGFYLPFINSNTSTYAGSFNGSSQYLSIPDSTNWNLGSTFTIEAWIYPTNTTSYKTIVARGSGGWYFSISSGLLEFFDFASGGSITTAASSIVANKWQHIAISCNAGTAKIYINGVASGAGATSYSVGTSTGTLQIGEQGTYGYKFAGNISNLRIVKGSAVYTSNFVPSSLPLTAITNTQLLTLQNATIIDNSTNAYTITNTGSVVTSIAYPFSSNIAADYSGNANNWTPNNIQVSTSTATTYDSMTDVPTLTSATVANYAVMNPLQNPYSSTFSNANMTVATASGSGGIVFSSMAMSAGKYYWEVTLSSGTSSDIGIFKTDATLSSSYLLEQAFGYSYVNGGQKFNNNVGTAYGASYTTNDVIGVAFDADNGTLTFYKNGTSQGTAFTSLTNGPYSAAIADTSGIASSTFNVNFGQRPFSYTPPTGYKALNTYNLPDSTIKKGNNYMDAVLYTGNGVSGRAVNTTTGFRPDFAWAKSRDVAGSSHILIDSNRGNTKYLISESTAAEGTASDLTFTSTGVTWNNGVSLNGNGYSYVNWFWQAGQGSTSSNTAGSITSTVSVSTTAGFSIVTYTGNGTNGATIGHGLGVAPRWVIVKRRDSSGDDWLHYHTSLGATKSIAFDTGAAITSSTRWNNTTPSSTLITLGTSTGVNGSGATYVAYCWAAISGYSAFGSYTGNGSTDGPFNYVGFRPKFIMLKRTDTTGNWTMYDATRNTYNAGSYPLYPNLSNAEDASIDHFDWLSNGFKMKSTNQNASGGTFIYACFASNPFKNSNAV